MGWNDFQRREGDHAPSIPAGKYKVIILHCEEKRSRSDNDMLEITLRVSGTKINVKYWIVQTGDYWQDKLNRFFDAFPTLNGSLVFPTWRGAIGAASIAEDDNGYLTVKRWVYPEAAESLGEFKWVPRDDELDEIPTPVEFHELPAEDDEDVPF